MRLVALRGANTVNENTAEAILSATDELMREILARNDARRRRPRELHLHAHAGPRRRSSRPSRRARWGSRSVPLLCAREIPVPGALPKVIRVLIHAYMPTGTARARLPGRRGQAAPGPAGRSVAGCRPIRW